VEQAVEAVPRQEVSRFSALWIAPKGFCPREVVLRLDDEAGVLNKTRRAEMGKW
jgi:hypothetical protein